MASKAMLFDYIVSSLISLAHYPDDENHLIVFCFYLSNGVFSMHGCDIDLLEEVFNSIYSSLRPTSFTIECKTHFYEIG